VTNSGEVRPDAGRMLRVDRDLPLLWLFLMML
jgi:hypothetical protein